MAKQNKNKIKNIQQSGILEPQTTAPIASPNHKPTYTIFDFKVQAIILAIIGLAFYCNTFRNGYAFDDKLVITQNEYVQAGMAGIPKILTTEAYESFSKQQKVGNPLTGGRYRPLSIVTFAIEQQFLGTSTIIDQSNATPKDINEIKAREAKLVTDMHLRHVINVLLYIITAIVLLYFLRTIIFPLLPLAAFLAALIFILHPIHTEVVANVKSRDEILSLLFICLTFIFTFRYQDANKIKNILLALVCYFLALLSKEYAVMLIVLLPLALYLFKNYSIGKSLTSCLLFLIPLAIYFRLRFASVTATAIGAEDEIMNNPYLYASQLQAIATQLATMLRYIQLLFLPIHLTADYSYNEIHFTDPKVWLSIIFYLFMLLGMVILIIKRHFLAFALAFYLAFFILVCNLFINIGAPMGERFIFHSSVGFSILIGWLLYKGYEKIKPISVANYSITGLMLLLIIVSGFKTIDRNQDWASDTILFLKDVQTAPNSIITNCNAGASCIDMAELATDTVRKREWLIKGLPYLDKAIALHNKYMLAYVNRGIIYFRINEYDKALSDCDSVRKYFAQLPSLNYLAYSLSDHFFKIGLHNGRDNHPLEAILYFKKAVEALPTDADIWYNLGYAYYSNNQIEDAKKAFTNALKIKPNHAQARTMLSQLNK